MKKTFIFALPYGLSRSFDLFEVPKRSVKENIVAPPLFGIKMTRVKTVFLLNPQLMPFWFP